MSTDQAGKGSESRFPVSVEELHESARGETGLNDFGDPAYLDGLRVLLDSYGRESKLHANGREMVRQELTQVLKSRLTVQQAWVANPAVLTHEIRRPIFILGLPRSGTTALHHLLAQDPANQVLEFWLAAAPEPRPPRESWATNPNFQRSADFLEAMYKMDPTLKTIHLLLADGPEECRHLLEQTFTDDTFECNATIPSYSKWYKANDMRASYARHRDILKLVGSPTPERRWVLKYPAHLRHLQAVFATYPDACVVQTHRDPGRVLPSLCSLIAGWRSLYEDNPDRQAIAEWQLGVWAGAMENGMKVRRERGETQFFDLYFREIVSDPVSAIRRIYEHFGLEFGAEAQRRMRAWHEANPQGKHGEHRYTAEEFGLSEAKMAERFAAYSEHFKVPAERQS